VAQWIRPRTLAHEVPGPNPLAAAVLPLVKALYPRCLGLCRGVEAFGPLVTCLPANCFLSGQVKQIKSKIIISMTEIIHTVHLVGYNRSNSVYGQGVAVLQDTFTKVLTLNLEFFKQYYLNYF